MKKNCGKTFFHIEYLSKQRVILCFAEVLNNQNLYTYQIDVSIL